jgi:type IV pilus assembly protein PilN
MKITLNLATRPYADQGPAIKRLRIGMLALVVVLGLLGLGLMHFHQAALKMAAQEDALDQSIAQIGREQRGYQAQMEQPPNAKVLTQARFLNRLFDEKSFSWTAAMEDLERVLPGGVQVTSIEPVRGKDGRLTLRLRVSGMRDRSVEMVRNMEHSRRFASPRISGENAETGNAQGDLQPAHDSGRVTFEVLAEYNPATLEERKAQIAAQKNRKPVADGPRRMAQPAVSQPQYVQPNVQPNMPPRQGVGVAPRTAPGMGFRPGAGQMPPSGPPGHPIRRNRPSNSNVPDSTQGGPQ